MATIYTIAHPLTDQIVYVGCSRSFKGRVRTHLNPNKQPLLTDFVLKLRVIGLSPKIEILDTCDFDEVSLFEKYWINQLIAWGYNLLNKYQVARSMKTKTHRPRDVSFKIESIITGEQVQVHADRLASFKATVSRYNKVRQLAIKFDYSGVKNDCFTATRIA